MSAFDISIIVLLVLPAVIGVFYGFLNIVFSLLSWALAFGASIKMLPYITPMLEGVVETELLRTALVFVALFIIFLVLLTLISYFIVKLLGRAGLTAADRILGLFFGMGLGATIVAVVVFLAGFTLMPQENWWQQSKLVDPFERIGIWCYRFLPDSIIEYHSYDATQTTN